MESSDDEMNSNDGDIIDCLQFDQNIEDNDQNIEHTEQTIYDTDQNIDLKSTENISDAEIMHCTDEHEKQMTKNSKVKKLKIKYTPYNDVNNKHYLLER